MENHTKALYIARLTSDKTKIKLGSDIFYLVSPSLFQRSLAEEIYQETLDSADEAYSEEDLLHMLYDQDIWSDELEERMKRLQTDFENLKVKLYTSRLHYTGLPIIRLGLEKTEEEINRLYSKRHSHDYLSRLFIAQSAKDRFLIGCGLRCSDGSPYWEDGGESAWDEPDAFLNRIIMKVNKLSLGLTDIREIARTEPWSGLWAMQKYTSNIFQASPIDLSDDQRTLIIWSSIYESVREHPDNLQSSIVEDDDMLDGWMILKRREREKDHIKEEPLTKNKKILAATEQFYMNPIGADPGTGFRSIEEVKTFTKMVNSEDALNTIKQRSNIILERGEVREGAMPDVALKNRMEQSRLLSERTKAINK